MTLCEFIGCSLIAFGPAVAMFVLTIAHDPISVIVVFASGFFWLLSAVLSSILWLIFDVAGVSSPVQRALTVIFSVLCQEAIRCLLYRSLTLLDDGLKNMVESTSPILNRKMLGYSAGIGFGVMSGIFSFINVLADAVGPATVGLKHGTETFFLVSAFFTMCMVLLQVFWSVILFYALSVREPKLHILFIVITHLLSSTLTFFNSSGNYAASFVPNCLILIVTACVAFRCTGGSLGSFKSSFSREREVYG